MCKCIDLCIQTAYIVLKISIAPCIIILSYHTTSQKLQAFEIVNKESVLISASQIGCSEVESRTWFECFRNQNRTLIQHFADEVAKHTYFQASIYFINSLCNRLTHAEKWYYYWLVFSRHLYRLMSAQCCTTSCQDQALWYRLRTVKFSTMDFLTQRIAS